MAGRGHVNRTPLTAEQQALAAAHMPLAHRLARRLCDTSPAVARLGLDEALGEGTLALVYAARTYRQGRQSFGTYAALVIRRCIYRRASRWGRLQQVRAADARPETIARHKANLERLAGNGWLALSSSLDHTDS